jgi:two-component system chemotaxis response regulator CheB
MLQSKIIMSSEKGGEYILPVFAGDIFISFHHPNGECIGTFLQSSDVNTKNLDDLQKQVLSFFKNNIAQIEVKMIGKSSAIDRVSTYLSSKKYTQLKKIVKEENIDVMFLPRMNKVRVSNNATIVPLNKKIKVLIVDDSKTIRNILAMVFQQDSQFEVCGMAELPSQVEGLIASTKPDVITLDIHMPEMDGVTLLKKIAPKYQIPCVMISSISMAEGPLVLEALENGAVDYIQKPEMSELETVIPIILEKVKVAAQSRKVKQAPVKLNKDQSKTCNIANLKSLVVIGASTGGTEAIRAVLTAMPKQIPPTLIVQHIPAVFSLAFANRMNDLCPFEVKEAEDGDEVRENRVLIAPGGKQMRMVHKNNRTYVEVNDDAPVNRFKPSVDYLFDSVAKNMFSHTIAVLLTGMGKDGAKGLLNLKHKFALTIAQDEKSCVVFGMPREAIEIGAADYVESIDTIADKICALTHEKVSRLKAKSA